MSTSSQPPTTPIKVHFVPQRGSVLDFVGSSIPATIDGDADFHDTLRQLSRLSCPHDAIGFHLQPSEIHKAPQLEPFSKGVMTTPHAWKTFVKALRALKLTPAKTPELIAVHQVCAAEYYMYTWSQIRHTCYIYQDCAPSPHTPRSLSYYMSLPPAFDGTVANPPVDLNDNPYFHVLDQASDSPIKGRAASVKLEKM